MCNIYYNSVTKRIDVYACLKKQSKRSGIWDILIIFISNKCRLKIKLARPEYEILIHYLSPTITTQGKACSLWALLDAKHFKIDRVIITQSNHFFAIAVEIMCNRNQQNADLVGLLFCTHWYKCLILWIYVWPKW